MPVTVTITGDTGTEVLNLMRDFVPAPNPVMPEVTQSDAQRAINYARSSTLAQLEESDRVNMPEDQEVDTDETPEIEVDSDGLPFDPDTMTGTKLKSGQWRMKNGVERPAAPNGSTSTASTTETAPTPNTDANDENAGPESEPSEPETVTLGAEGAVTDDEDEFAAFRDAAAQEEPPEAAPIGARTWTDADLGALCNQAALKMGDPEPIKKLIASFTPEGQVAHSRNIPQDQREVFAVALEQKADIEFAG